MGFSEDGGTGLAAYFFGVLGNFGRSALVPLSTIFSKPSSFYRLFRGSLVQEVLISSRSPYSLIFLNFLEAGVISYSSGNKRLPDILKYIYFYRFKTKSNTK